jgi:type I restriction enzyme R subunit
MSIDANFDEAKQSQLPTVEILINLGYNYLSKTEIKKQRGGDDSKFILSGIAFEALNKINSYQVGDKSFKFSPANINRAIEELERVPLEGLIDAAKDIYGVINSASSKTFKEYSQGKESSYSFGYIDFENPLNNRFDVALEVVFEGRGRIRCDVVCYINGIPLVVIENKKSSVDVGQALNQLNDYQKADYCPKLFTYTQLLIGTNKTELLYGTTGTPPKFYAKWQEKDVETSELDRQVLEVVGKEIDTELYGQILVDLNGATFGHTQIRDRVISEQDRSLFALLRKERLLDLVHNFIIFDAGVKKISRYQQYFGVKKILDRVHILRNGGEEQEPKGGLVWHTQGSGKSLTMVMLVKALIEDPKITNPRVIVVTDRVDLDKQIQETFKNCGLKKDVVRAEGGKHLIKLIKEKDLNVITTLIQKFESAAKKFYGFVDKSENVFILIDEAHRTQAGVASQEMRKTLPNAYYIGFTGTPLLKKDKSRQTFGSFIDKYTIDDAQRDGVVVPLIYEGRYVNLEQNKQQIDRQFERMTDLSTEQKKNLQKYVNKNLLKSVEARIEEISFDVEEHYVQNFQGTGLKAQLVAPSKYTAVLFDRFFKSRDKVKTAVVISNSVYNDDEVDDNKREVKEFLNQITEKYRSLESYEMEVIKSFKDSDDGVEIIIVVDKLLTGFDAPRNTVLYLTKDLKDHNLLQAIARVNRLFDGGKIPKSSGYIIDYSENARNLSEAMKLFTRYDEQDVKNALFGYNQKVSDLETAYSDLEDLFRGINKKDDGAYLEFLKPENKRKEFYDKFNSFVKNFNECMVLHNFSSKFDQFNVYKQELKKYLNLRGSTRKLYADTQDFAEYKLALRRILDKNITADEVELLTKPIEITNLADMEEVVESLGSDKSKAEAIAAQTKKTITEKVNTDPAFYNKFSAKIEEILLAMREGKLSDTQALFQLKDCAGKVLNKQDNDLPEVLKTNSIEAVLYRNLRKYFEGLAKDQYLKIIQEIVVKIKTKTMVDWHKNTEVQRVIKNQLDDYLYELDSSLNTMEIVEAVSYTHLRAHET